MSFTQYTYCVTCRNHDGLHQFVWADTGESLTAYRTRMKQNIPSQFVPYIQWGTPILGVIVGLIAASIAISVQPKANALTLIVAGLIAGGVIGAFLGMLGSQRLGAYCYKNP